jgi:UPF0716 protein FxsA
MGIILLAAFILIPLVEIWVFIEVGGEIGALTTVAICILTAVVGMAMLRAQGLVTLMRARQQMDEGVLPAKELFDGLCLLVAGAFLLTPGFVTDGFGFALLIPAFRDVLRALAGRHLARHASVHVGPDPAGRRPGRGRPDVTIIEGEFEEIEPDDGSSRGGSNRGGSNREGPNHPPPRRPLK